MNASMDTMKHSLWHKVTSYVLTAFMMMQLTLPSVASAMTSISNSQLNDELTAEQMFMRSALAPYLYERSRYIPKLPSSYANQTIEELHTKLKANHTHRLKSEIATDWIPIAGDITIFIPKERTIYPLYKQVGDKFVQRKVVGNQIKRLIGRTYYKSGFTSEQAQISQLYTNAYTLASKSTFNYQLGDTLPEGIADTLKTDFIWPESRNIGGQYVLVPVVHLQTATVDKKGIDGTHTVEFKKSNATFRSAKISNADLKLQNETVFRTINDLVIGTKSSISIDDSAARIYAGVSFIDNGSGSVQGVASGTLYNYGQINSARNVDIVAGNYQQKTFVHRFKTAHGYEDRLGSISAINAGGGISIRTYGDILLEGATVAANGGSINLYANGNISIGAVALENSSSFKVKGGKKNAQGVNYVQSILSAQDNISLYAAGIIEINASELHAEEGAIQVLAQNGIYILNEFDQSSSNMDRKWRKTTETEQQFETIAIRSVLEAGKGVTIASDYGDITLKATKINSGDGSEISAHNGRVNLLLAKEQDHYYYNKVRKGFWKIKTETKQDTTDTAVYNEIIGGVKVHATHGITLELGQYEGESVTDVINQFAGSDSLSWMADIYNDPKYNCPAPTQPPRDDFYSRTVFEAIQQDADFNNCTSMLDVVYKKLEDIHIHEKTSNLSPAAMAIIAIAVSVAMGPGGFELLGTNGIGSFGVISAPAMQAGAATLATSVATSLANGDGIDGAIKKITSSDGLRSLAISMATAGVLNSEAMQNLDFFKNADFTSSFFASESAIDIANQAMQAVVESTIRAGISTAIRGGSFSDFSDAFKTSLKMHAVNELGEYMAGKIGASFDGENGNDALKYISHAASGCIIGAATAAVNKSAEENIACAAGAGGAVIGEYIASNLEDSEKYKNAKKAAKEEYEAFFDSKKAMIAKWKADNPSISTEEIQFRLNQGASRLNAFAEMERLKAAGVDFAKLGAAFSAFVAGADASSINIAGNAGATSAEFNTFSDYTIVRYAQSILDDYMEGLRSNPDGVIGAALSRAADNVFAWGLDPNLLSNEALQSLYELFPERLKAQLQSAAISNEDKVTIAAAMIAGLLDVGSGVGTTAEALVRVGLTWGGDESSAQQNGQLAIDTVSDLSHIIENHEVVFEKVMQVVATTDTNIENRALLVRFVTAAVTAGAAGFVSGGTVTAATLPKMQSMLRKLEAQGVDLTELKRVTGIDDIKSIDTDGDGKVDSYQILALPPEIFPSDLVSLIARSTGKTTKEIEAIIHDLKYAKGADFDTLLSSYLGTSNKFGLNFIEANAIFSYTTNWFFKGLNKSLREGNVSKDQLKLTNLIVSALEKLPNVSGEFVRRVELSQSDIDKYIKARRFGTTVIEKQFTSISAGNTPLSKYNGNVVFKFETSSAKDISSFAMDVNFYKEIGSEQALSEFVISANSKFKVKNIKDESGILYIYMKQVN